MGWGGGGWGGGGGRQSHAYDSVAIFKCSGYVQLFTSTYEFLSLLEENFSTTLKRSYHVTCTHAILTCTENIIELTFTNSTRVKARA